MIDTYYDRFAQNPRLPMFVIREINRDAEMLLNRVIKMQIDNKLHFVISSLKEEMES